MLIVLLVMASVVSTAVAVVVGGLLLPTRHSVSHGVHLRAAPASVWSLVANPVGYAAWQRRVQTVELLDRAPLRWREFGDGGSVALEVTQLDAPVRFVAVVLDEDVTRRPERTFTLAEEDGGTRVTYTEASVHRNPVARFIYRYWLKPDHAIIRVLQDLQRTLGE